MKTPYLLIFVTFISLFLVGASGREHVNIIQPSQTPSKEMVETPLIQKESELTTTYFAKKNSSSQEELTNAIASNSLPQINRLLSSGKLAFKEKIALKIIRGKMKKDIRRIKKGKKTTAGKSQLVAILLCFFIGYLGIHRFYLGYVGIGLIQLFTAGLCGIWTLIDFILLLFGALKPKDGDYGETIGEL